MFLTCHFPLPPHPSPSINQQALPFLNLKVILTSTTWTWNLMVRSYYLARFGEHFSLRKLIICSIWWKVQAREYDLLAVIIYWLNVTMQPTLWIIDKRGRRGKLGSYKIWRQKTPERERNYSCQQNSKKVRDDGRISENLLEPDRKVL